MRGTDADGGDESDSESESENKSNTESVLSLGDAEPARALQLAICSLVTITAFLNQNDLQVYAENDVDLDNHALTPFHNALSNLIHSWAHSSGKAMPNMRKPAIPRAAPGPTPPADTRGPTQTNGARTTTRPPRATNDPVIIPTYAGAARNGRGTNRLSDNVRATIAAAKGNSRTSLSENVRATIAVAKNFPNMNAAGVARVVSTITDPTGRANKPAVKHAPRGAYRSIQVRFAVQNPLDPEVVPNDQTLLVGLREIIDPYLEGFAELDGRQNSVQTVAVRGGAIAITFAASLPEDTGGLEAAIAHAVTRFATDPEAGGVDTYRFKFTSKVVFRRVPIVGTGIQNTTPETVIDDITANEHWGRLDYTREPTVFSRPGDAHALVFLEFRDNATSSVMKGILMKPLYLNGTLCRAVKTWDREAPAKRCTECLMWGHTGFHCRANARRCGHCGGTHDERVHRSNCTACIAEASRPGVSAMDRPARCPHPPKCANCGQAHRSDSTDCTFYTNRFNKDWIRNANAANRPAPANSRQAGRSSQGGT